MGSVAGSVVYGLSVMATTKHAVVVVANALARAFENANRVDKDDNRVLFLQLERNELVTATSLRLNIPGRGAYVISVCLPKETDSSTLEGTDYLCIQTVSPAKIREGRQVLKALPPTMLVRLQAEVEPANNPNMRDLVSVSVWPADSPSDPGDADPLLTFPCVKVKDPIIGPLDFSQGSKEEGYLWSEDPEDSNYGKRSEVVFFIDTYPGYYFTTLLKKWGDSEELNQVHSAITQTETKLIEGDTFVSNQPTTPPPVAPAPPPPAPAPPPQAPAPPPAAQPDQAPSAPPESPKPTPLQPPMAPPSPETTSAPPIAPGANPGPPVEEPPKRRNKKRTKEEIRLDKIKAAVAVVMEEKDADDVRELLVGLADFIVSANNMSIDQAATEQEATLQGTLASLEISLRRATELAAHAQNCTEGLETREQFLAKLATALG